MGEKQVWGGNQELSSGEEESMLLLTWWAPLLGLHGCAIFIWSVWDWVDSSTSCHPRNRLPLQSYAHSLSRAFPSPVLYSNYIYSSISLKPPLKKPLTFLSVHLFSSGRAWLLPSQWTTWPTFSVTLLVPMFFFFQVVQSFIQYILVEYPTLMGKSRVVLFIKSRTASEKPTDASKHIFLPFERGKPQDSFH